MFKLVVSSIVILGALLKFTFADENAPSSDIGNPVLEAIINVNSSCKHTVVLAVTVKDGIFTEKINENTSYYVNCTPGPVIEPIAQPISLVKMTNLKSNTEYTCKVELHKNNLIIRQSEAKRFKTENFGVFVHGTEFQSQLNLNGSFDDRIKLNVNITTPMEGSRPIKFRIHCEPGELYGEIQNYQSIVEITNITSGINYTCKIEHNCTTEGIIPVTSAQHFMTKEVKVTSPLMMAGLCFLLLALIVFGLYFIKRKKILE